MRTRPLRFLASLIAAAAVAAITVDTVSSAAPAQTANPRFGKWRLKPTDPAGPPSTNVMVYAPHNDTGMKITINRLNPDGTLTEQWGYTTMFDNKDEPMTGSRAKDTAAVKMISDRTAEITYKRSGRITQILTNVLSPDAQTLGIIYMSMDEAGKTTRVTFATYERMQ
jgi:hypothetical protein